MKKKFTYYLAASIALAAFIFYLPALRNAFVGVWDDNAYIVENIHIRSLDAAFFRWAFFDFYASNWHPLNWISHAIDYSLWGMNPLGHHLTSIVLHAINTSLVVLLVLKLLEFVRESTTLNPSTAFLTDRTVLIAAGVTGLLFGIHPVHVESVAWVAERKDLLCALFFLLSVMAYVKYARGQGAGVRGQESGAGNQESGVRSPKPADSGNAKAGPKKSFINKHYLLSLGFFILALMSKPMAVSLPVVLLILDWYPFNRIRSLKTLWSASIEKIPFLALSLASSIITILAQRAGESIISLQIAPLSSRVLVAVQSLIAYLGKMLLPLNLIPFYPYAKDVSLFSFEYLFAIALVTGITAAGVVLVKKQKFWLSAWGYYMITLIPVLGIVQVGNQSMADRYMYLPSLGPFLIAGLCAAWIAEKVCIVPRWGIGVKLAFTGSAIVVFSLMSYITFQQTGIWENGFVLWNHAINKGFESATAYNNRGLSLEDMGRNDEAIADFERAIALDQRNYFAYNNMGVLYGKDGQFHKSIGYFFKAIAVNPKHADSYCNLGLSYFNINQYDSALDNYNKAIQLKQDFDAAYLNRGILYFTLGNKELALANFRKACDLRNKKACEAFHLLTQEFLSR